MSHEHTDIPHDLLDMAQRLDALAEGAPPGLEDRVFHASVAVLREAQEGHGGVLARIGLVRWLAPIAAAAAVGVLAWGGSVLLAPGVSTPGQPDRVATVALDEHVLAALEYADLFSEVGWVDTLTREAEAIEGDWQPTIDAVTLDGEMGAG